MVTNSSLTIYHKEYDETSRLEVWERTNYSNAWFFGSINAGLNEGYQNSNNVDIRIPLVEKIDLDKIKIGDILVKGKETSNITTQQDLIGKEVYNITSIKVNNFGNTPHIHLQGK